MATTTSRPVTFAELELMPDAPDGRYELRHGELVKVPPPEFPHFRIQRRLRKLLESAAPAVVAEIEFAFRALREYEYRIADVACVSKDRWEKTGRYFDGVPDIVIEVLSLSNTVSEMFDKEQLCLENGAKEFWVVDPVRRQVKISTSDGKTMTFREGQSIPLVFGGDITVGEIFE